MSIFSYDAVFGAALTQENVPPRPEESCRLNRLPNDPLTNVLNYLPDEDVLQLFRACPNDHDPELQEVREASSSRECMRNSVLPELVNSTRYRNGFEKLKAAVRRGDLMEGALSGIMGGIAGPRLLGIAAGTGAMTVLDAMLTQGVRPSIIHTALSTLVSGAVAITPLSLGLTQWQMGASFIIEEYIRMAARITPLPKQMQKNMKTLFGAVFIATQLIVVGQQIGGIRAFLGTPAGRLTALRTILTGSLAINAVLKIRSNQVQGLFSMAVAGAAARLISNCIAEAHFTENREMLRPILAACLSTLAGIFTIK